MWETLANALLRFVEQWGDLALFVVILIEESGVPLPLPGDLILIWAGYRVHLGESHLLDVLGLVELATVIGASTLYLLARRGGRPLILRYGRFLHLNEHKLAVAESWVARNAFAAIVVGRVAPGLRIATPLAAGVFQVPYRTFLPALMVGAGLYAVIWVGVGYFFGPTVIELLHHPRLTGRLVLSLVVLVALALLTWRIHRSVLPERRALAFQQPWQRKLEAAGLAGLLATLEMALVIGSLLIAFAEFGWDLPGLTLLRAVSPIAFGRNTLLGVAFAPLSILLLAISGIVWAVVYAFAVEPRLHLPDWLKGTLFAIAPTLVSWFVWLPLLGAGAFGLRLEAGLLPAAGELVRHLLYGAALGLAYPMLLLARRPWHEPAAASARAHVAD